MWFQITLLCSIGMKRGFSDLGENYVVFCSGLETLMGYMLPLLKNLTSKIFAKI